MICKKCGFENNEENEVCEACKEPLEKEDEKPVIDRILALSAFTFCVVFLLSFLLLLVLFLFK